MKTIISTLALAVISLATLNAQRNSFYIGANGGGNFSKFKFTEDLAELYPGSNPVFGLNGGATMGFEIQNFTISTGIQYIQKGGEYQTENFDGELGTAFFTGREKLHFLSVPVLVGYRAYLAPRVAVSIAIGPSFNFGLSGNLNETTEYFGTDETKMDNYKLAFGNGVNEDYRPTMVGFQVSPGLVVALNETSKITFNVTWDSGVADMFNPRYKDANEFFTANKGDQLSRSTIFSVGYEYHFNFADRY